MDAVLQRQPMTEITPTEVRFDPFAPEFTRDPYPILRRLREQGPAAYWEQGKGWVFFRYRDIMPLLRDPRLVQSLGAHYSEEFRRDFPDFVALREHDVFNISPEAHSRIRRLINPYFNPRGLEVHKPRVESLIRGVLAELPESGVVNVAADYSRRYPVRVISGMLNIPAGHEDEFVAFADALIATIDPTLSREVFASFMPAVSAGARLVREAIADRRAHPLEGDLLTDLIQACDQNERLSEGELLSLVSAVLIGGSDTTVSLTTYAIMELLRHPDQLAALRAEPQHFRSCVDETLRYNSFGRGGLVRFVREPFTHAGVALEANQPIYLQTMSAFRDPEFLPDCDVYDVRRQQTSSPWFGLGAHFCIGASLARLEAELALRLFFERYPEVRLAGEPVYSNHPVLRHILELPVRVGPGARA